ncbi:MAG TPA: ADP-ribosylglycohydrolase family protein, partial [Holophaga sp.]|nr:ADP-ribosylglycohydrolase family protein [Holophaga sp.]
WTDDTSMALCLAASLVEKKGFDPVDQLERYLRWYKDGYFSVKGYCFDIGGTTRAALAKFEETRKPYCGSISPRASGNGSIMRLAPVPLQTVCVRHVPTALAGDETALAAHNRTLADRVNQGGRCYLTSSVLKGRLMLRLSLGAQGTEPRHVALLWEELQRAADQG